MLIYGSTRRTGHAHLPERFGSSGGINEFELASAVCALHSAALVFPGRPIVLRCDDSAEALTLVRGNCVSGLGRKLADVFLGRRACAAHPRLG